MIGREEDSVTLEDVSRQGEVLAALHHPPLDTLLRVQGPEHESSRLPDNKVIIEGGDVVQTREHGATVTGRHALAEVVVSGHINVDPVTGCQLVSVTDLDWGLLIDIHGYSVSKGSWYKKDKELWQYSGAPI